MYASRTRSIRRCSVFDIDLIRKRWSGDTKKKALERPDAIAFEMTRMDDRVSPCGSARLAKNSVSEMCSAFRTWANRSESLDRKVDLAPTPGPGYSRVAEPVPGAAESVSVIPRWSSSARSPNQSAGDTPMRFSAATWDLPLPGLAGGDVSSAAALPASLASAEGPAASDMVRVPSRAASAADSAVKKPDGCRAVLARGALCES